MRHPSWVANIAAYFNAASAQLGKMLVPEKEFPAALWGSA